MEWERGRHLGSGSFAKVYEATLAQSGKMCAVKVLELGKDDDVAAVQRRNQDEVHIMKDLSHRNVVEMIGSCASEDKMYIFMELAAGGSLRSFIRRLDRHPVEHRVLQCFVRQILQGLHYLHHKRIIHRDIKPENILLSAHAAACDKVLKLADFGVSKHSPHGAFSQGCRSQDKGTADYMAPEAMLSMEQMKMDQCEITPYGYKVDIWAVGCVVIELHGRPVWDFSIQGPKDLRPMLLMMHIASSSGPPTGMPARDECNPDAHELMERCFERDPKSRAKTAELLQMRLCV